MVRAFAFLIDEQGFARAEAGAGTVCFERGDVVVSITREPRSCEIIASVGLRNDRTTWTHVMDIARLDGAPEPARLGNCEAASAESARFVLDGLARLQCEHGADALRGDRADFDRYAAAARARNAAYTANMRLGPALDAADAAWARKDYAAVVALLEPIRVDLGETHSRRLEFARKRSDR